VLLTDVDPTMETLSVNLIIFTAALSATAETQQLTKQARIGVSSTIIIPVHPGPSIALNMKLLRNIPLA